MYIGGLLNVANPSSVINGLSITNSLGVGGSVTVVLLRAVFSPALHSESIQPCRR